jgi:hypothetical protein
LSRELALDQMGAWPQFAADDHLGQGIVDSLPQRCGAGKG